MTTTQPIGLRIDQVRELPVGASRDGMHAYLDVRTRGLDASALGGAPEAAEVIIVDCSGSMGSPSSKLQAARDAATAAVDALRDGTRFAVVEGTHRAAMVYPRHADRLAVADHDTRARAASRIRHLFPEGGTAIGTWLGLARGLLADDAARVKHAVLLTDGHNVSRHDLLTDELARCQGLFRCDARGIGDGWSARELLRITDRLDGSASAVLRDSDLAAEFEALVRASMARTLPSLTIRVSLTTGVRLRYLKQVHPREQDLTADGEEVDGRTLVFPTEPWGGDEVRQYHLCLDADPREQPRHEDLQLAWVEVAAGTDRVPDTAPVPVLVRWLPGERRSTQHSRSGWHFLRHEDLGLAVAEAYEAFDTGDMAAAERALGTAVGLAHALGHHRLLAELAEIVDITDAAAGEVRQKADADPRRIGRLLMSSRHSVVAPAPDADSDLYPDPDGGRPTG
ncbi:VWA domain-containing protein [Streptomyces sp. SBT349]|uniref:VWA domain-containing protein n=1 Tax=Streptomyces sp. SBT349 TaxID=1580539 RepID=UPI00066DC4DE|nr:vWA domain-containing protein [Streptomyces sp. SBT349]